MNESGKFPFERLALDEVDNVKIRVSSRQLFLAGSVLIVIFHRPLFQLCQFARTSELYSYIFLVPLIVGFLVWEKRASLPSLSAPFRSNRLHLIAGGAAIVALYYLLTSMEGRVSHQDYLALTTSAFLLCFTALLGYFFGKNALIAFSSPLSFLVFLVPIPSRLEAQIVSWLQHGSARVADQLFGLAGTPVFYQDLVFRLPNIRIEVAPECSGIRSTVALFITSLLAVYFFVKTPWKGFILTLAVIPLAMLRNGLRIFAVGELCVYKGPEMIDSPLHTHGGPLFFALSLVPFILLLWCLSRSDSIMRNNQPSVH